MEIINMTLDNDMGLLDEAISNKIDRFIWTVIDSPIVIAGKGDGYDKEYCEYENRRVIKPQHKGGALITSIGDITFAHISKEKNNRYAELFLENLTNILGAKGANAKLEGNDVLIDGVYKVASMSTQLVNGMRYSTIFLSVNPNLEQIKKICTKPMKKIPLGLKEFGFTTQSLLDLIFEYNVDNINGCENKNCFYCQEVFKSENCYYCHDCLNVNNMIFCDNSRNIVDKYAICNRIVTKERFDAVKLELIKFIEQDQYSIESFAKSLNEYNDKVKLIKTGG